MEIFVLTNQKSARFLRPTVRTLSSWGAAEKGRGLRNKAAGTSSTAPYSRPDAVAGTRGEREDVS